jgi:phenylalanyl-tRNA synthetase beta subunit
MRSNPEHMAQLEKLNINTIDIVAVNLYPFKATIMKEGVTFADLSECWNKLGLQELNNVKVIDTYEKDGVKSITVRLIFSSKEKTLEMDEVQAWIDEILANLKAIGIEMRA